MREDRPRRSARGRRSAAWPPRSARCSAAGSSRRSPGAGVFVINVPLGIFVIWAAARHVPETRDPDASPAPRRAGSVLATIGLAAVDVRAGRGRGRRPADRPCWSASLAVGAAALVAFWFVDAAQRQPDAAASRCSPPASSRPPTSSPSSVYAALGGVFFLLVVVLQTALGFSALAAGAASLPITVLMLLLSSRAGALAQRIGPRLPLTVGPLLIAAGMLLLVADRPGRRLRQPACCRGSWSSASGCRRRWRR